MNKVIIYLKLCLLTTYYGSDERIESEIERLNKGKQKIQALRALKKEGLK